MAQPPTPPIPPTPSHERTFLLLEPRAFNGGPRWTARVIVDPSASSHSCIPPTLKSKDSLSCCSCEQVARPLSGDKPRSISRHTLYALPKVPEASFSAVRDHDPHRETSKEPLNTYPGINHILDSKTVRCEGVSFSTTMMEPHRIPSFLSMESHELLYHFPNQTLVPFAQSSATVAPEASRINA